MIQPINLLEELTENDKLLIIEPHPDDAIISCGSLFEYAPSKLQLYTMSYGEAAYGTPSDHVAAFRSKETQRLVETYSLFFTQDNFADGKFSEDDKLRSFVDKLFHKITSYIERHRPTYVFVTSANDKHPDHAFLGKEINMIKAYCWENGMDIKFFECDSTTSLTNFTHYVPLQYDMLIPDQLIRFYPSQAETMQDFVSGFSGLARYRGMQIAHEKNVHYAQVFNLLK